MKDGSSSRPNAGRGAAPPVPDPERTTFDWPRHAGTADAVLHEMELQVRLRRRRHRRVRAAASAIVALVVVGWIWRVAVSPRASQAGVPVAAAALPARQVLPDGSVVLLRAGADLNVDFSATIRRVVLTQGEALFEVVKNTERPFIVRAAGVDVRAVGTAFAVDLKPATVEVLVTEGQVAVEKNTAPAHGPGTPMTISAPRFSVANEVSDQMLALVSARNRVVVDIGSQPVLAKPEVMPVSEDEINDRLAWRVAKLEFSRTPLAEAIAMVNQHARRRLVLEDTALEKVRLSGAIRADNIDALLQLLESDYGIKAEYRGETEIVLRRSR